MVFASVPIHIPFYIKNELPYIVIQSENDYHDRSAFNLIINEQSSLLLLGIGLFGLAGASRKKNKKNNKL
ncbi:uncharacterized protein Dvar_73580 [Desulfosarcina variabilis str. Montpellier]|uniref:hypothetical protein n=1 Tax=Desulfosarcina variabilis TaxID=2300 RepID=UPI003AFA6BF0